MQLSERSALAVVIIGASAIALGVGLVVAAVLGSIAAGVGAGITVGGAEALLGGLTLVDVDESEAA